MSLSGYGFLGLNIVPITRAPRPNAVAMIMNIRTGKYSDGIYVPGISGYVILKSVNSCQVKN